jgi:CBS domain-containing protein
MKVRECMSRDVRTIAPERSIQEAARLMAALDFGALPVGENDRIVGMVTDRDIVIRGVAEGCTPDTAIRDVMSGDIKYCFEDEDVDHVVSNMSNLQVRRLPVLDRSKRLVGIVALGDIAQGRADCDTVGEALAGISQPSSRSERGDGARLDA